MTENRTTVEIENLRKYYRGPGEVVHAVDGITLSLAEGEFVALFGPSGAGKTTLLLLLSAMLGADSGSIRYRGRDLYQMSNDELTSYRRKEVGFIFQGFFLLPQLNARDNVALRYWLLGDGYREGAEKAHEMLDTVGLKPRARHIPRDLSGGEKQRVAIARALAGTPGLILADEPTGNLDTERGREILRTLDALRRKRGVSVILATHDLRAIHYADRVHEIRDGRLYDFDSKARLAELAAP